MQTFSANRFVCQVGRENTERIRLNKLHLHYTYRVVSLRKTINRVGHILLTAICDFSSRFLMCCIFSRTLIKEIIKNENNKKFKKKMCEME